MKKVEAVIRSSKFEQVKQALHEIEVNFFIYYPVHGVGNTDSETSVWRGVTYAAESIRRTKLEILLQDQNVEKVIKAICDNARTGDIGDGKVLVENVEYLIRVRTGEESHEGL